MDVWVPETTEDDMTGCKTPMVLAALAVLGLPACGGSEPGQAVATDGTSAKAASTAEQDGSEPLPLPLLELVSASGSGRLYTLDQDEAMAAVTDHGMSLRPGRVGYLPAEEFDGSAEIYRLKARPDASSWLFTTSTTERDRLVDEDWVDEGTTGYVYSDPGPGLVRLMRFTNGREWRLALESETTGLEQEGYTLDGPLGYVHETWIRAGAVYFGMFNPEGHQTIIRRTEEVYGRAGDPWGGVRDFYDGHPNGSVTWPDEDFSYLQPSIGYYDDSESETLEQHITQATSAGLSFFNFYWYWDPENQREKVTSASLEAFLSARNRNAIDFTVGVCAHPFGSLSIPVDQYGVVAETLVDRYLSQDNTLRTNDGRKILNICDARGLGDGSPQQIGQFIDAVQSRADQELGEDIYVMINQAGFDPGQVPQAGGDAAYCTTDGPAISSGSYETYLGGQRDFYARAPGEYGRCVLSDFDERPRYPIEKADVQTIRWLPDHSMTGFRQALGNARQDIAGSSRPPTVDNLVFIYAWNEWHEGGVIEPNQRDGCAHLDAVREELRLTTGDGCIEAPPLGE